MTVATVTAPVLAVETLSRDYGGGMWGTQAVRALDRVSFTLDPGEILGVVGESGCGKSTLARLVAALDRPTGGRVRLAGASLFELSSRVLRQHRRDVQMVFQDPYGSLDPRFTVGAIVAEPLDLLSPRRSRAERTARIGAMLESVGLERDAATRYPHAFSGGQRQRIAIARALATAPKLVVADEPTSALDLSMQAQVLNLVLDLRRDRGTSFLLISHNLAAVGAVADRVVVMFRGRIVESGPAASVLSGPLHPYAALLLASEPIPGRAAMPSECVPAAIGPPCDWSGCAFRDRCPRATERCIREAPVLRDIAGSHATACHHPHARATAASMS